MRVVEMTAWQVRIPLRKPIRHASFTRTETDNVVIRARLADGTVGFGEGVPREYVTGETIDQALENGQRVRPALFAECTDGFEIVRVNGRSRQRRQLCHAMKLDHEGIVTVQG